MNFKIIPRLCKSLVMISAIGFFLQMTCLIALLAHTVHSQAISVKEMPISLEVHDQNLVTITDYRGWDPETQSSSLPPLRIITAGLTVSL